MEVQDLRKFRRFSEGGVEKVQEKYKHQRGGGQQKKKKHLSMLPLLDFPLTPR
jgi:hypothetical protein